MAREKFTESAHCSFNSRCKACREASNADFRKSLAQICDLPGDNVNFDCPHGMAWRGEKPAAIAANYEPKAVPAPGAPTAPKPGTQPGKPGGCGCKGRTVQGSVVNPQTGQPTEIRIPNPEFMANIPRVQCPDCTRKHLAQAIINLQESIDGHPELRVLAVGHLCEACSECRQILPDISAQLDETWRRMFKEPTFIPELMPVIEAISKRIEEAANGLQGTQAATPTA